MKFSIYLFWISLFVHFQNFSHSQNNFHKKYNVNDGLLSSDNYMTFQDREGFIWICSEKGLVKFDGLNFKSFTIKNGLPINDIWYINEDSEGRMWLGGFFKGLYYIKKDSVYNYNKANHLSSLLYTSSLDDSLFFYSTKSNKGYYLIDDELIQYGDQDSTTNIIRPKYNTLEITTKLINDFAYCSSLIHLPSSTVIVNKKIDIKAQLQNFDKQFVRLTKTDNWLIFNSELIKEINPAKYFGERIDKVLTITPTGEVVTKSNNELRVYKDLITKERDFLLEKKLKPFKNTNISWITKDNENNLWLTPYRSDIVFIPTNNQHITRYYLSTKIDDNNLRNLTKIGSKIYFNNLHGSLFEFDINKKQINQPFKGVEGYNVEKIGFVGELNAKLYYSKSSSIFIQKGNHFNEINRHEKLKGTIRPKIEFLNDSTFLSAYFNEFTIKNDVFSMSKKRTLISDRLTSFISTSEFFISGGYEGLYFFNKKTEAFKSYKFNSIQSLKEHHGKLYIGTNGNGLIITNLNGEKLVSKHIGVSINDIEIEGNLIYLATNTGIYIEKITDNGLKTIKRINSTDGLTSNETISLLLDGSILYAGTVDGFNVINVDGILNVKLPAPKISLNQIKINNKTQKDSLSELSWNENNLMLSYTGKSFYSLGNITYYYRLKGLTEEWTQTKKNEIRYWSLPAGIYTFEVFAESSNGIKSLKTEEYNFRIKKHFIDTWWFFTLITLGLLGITIAIIARIQKKKSERLVTEKKFANLEMKALQSQMNPHFIFNSLNAMQSILFLKGEEESNKYIGAFSKLMRITLDNSKKSTITLKEEIEYLELYIGLEKRRLNNNLDYSITVSDKIDIDKIVIPSMIFQPIVENAILHGLIPKKTNRELVVKFDTEDNSLFVSILDNGVGRKAAMEKQKGKEYKSWASSILKEKIEVLNRLNQSKVTYEIIDLEKENVAYGTEVKIILPLNYEN